MGGVFFFFFLQFGCHYQKSSVGLNQAQQCITRAPIGRKYTLKSYDDGANMPQTDQETVDYTAGVKMLGDKFWDKFPKSKIAHTHMKLLSSRQAMVSLC